MSVTITDNEAKKILIKIREYEKEYGTTVEDILLDIIYQKEDFGAAIEAIRLYYDIVYSSGVDLEEIEREIERENKFVEH